MATDLMVDEKVAPGMVLEGIPWVVYRTLRALPGCGHIRMTYLDGTLYLMSPEYVHERGASNLTQFIIEVTGTLGIEVEPTGMTTLRRKGRLRRRGAGKEPDTGFYIEHADRMRGKLTINLAVDPPPDLAIEVDNKADSKSASETYARIAVPEVWRYRPKRRTLWFGRLVGGEYETIGRSRVLPMLTPESVLDALDGRVTGGMSLITWRAWLADWARALPAPPRP